MVKIAIIDYGLGNLRSIHRSLEKIGAEVTVTHEREEILKADALVLPGVGAFQEAVRNIEPVSGIILDQIGVEKPLLGICLGLQLLFTESTEGGLYKGLDVFKGRILRLPSGVKVPHIGWNTLEIVKEDNPVLKDIRNGAYVYFVHSYYADAENKEEIAAKTSHGLDFPSVVSSNHVFATQFHPERSGKIGLRILKNFIDYVRS